MSASPQGEGRPARPENPHRWGQVAVGLVVLVVAVVMAVGAARIPSEAGYAGVGPDFLPWLVSIGLGLCGLMLAREGWSAGWRNMKKPSGAARGDWPALAWVVAAVAVNAALIETIGFIFACTLCYALAVRGLRQSEGKAQGGWRGVLRDVAVGACISAPVFWLFTLFLGVNLPGLTATGWL